MNQHRAAPASKPEPRVLVIFPGALGDLICAGPALEAIARMNPACAVELMAKPELARFAVRRFPIMRGHSIDRREVTGLFVAGGEPSAQAREFFSHFARIYSYLAYNDPQFLQCLERCAPGRVVFQPFKPPGDGHVVAAYLKMLGQEANNIQFRLRPQEADLSSAAAALGVAGLDPKSRFVAIFPGSGGRTKNWPVTNFIVLATSLPAGTRPLVILGPAEQELREQFAARAVPTLLDLELDTVTGIARMAAAFVGNDSGVSHLAAAAGASGVVIFGPTSPDRWRPLGRVTVIAHPELTSISVAAVAGAIASMLPHDPAS
jgi:heptosyltransferase III